MLSSRGVQLVRSSKLLKNYQKISCTSVRNSGGEWIYRRPPPRQPEILYKLGEFVSAVSWWWILWHLWTEPGHVIGEFHYPNPRLWTNEELGISGFCQCN
ncbi:hypothetical protein PPYR_07556 [Photinus pyralis]|uniref:NADH dehydrogenase [ubiquinone] 1 beta subcomplex subunit 2, mitochondrial n=1 Tax=Photinus pyralis TaxID=7054 RepID=A0A5N4AQV2_PHOPY|nr:NADH dehydrogenase [ubiquinone] 1 beta subcomplex subunit 2, mitochondrial-like [Photinus pyralis]KAB0799676.1 hypothetical protein PPYR_07556 [Photinus pyralis]